MATFTAVACLLGIAAILSFVNDRFLRLQHDIGLLLLAGLTTAGLRVLEFFVPSGLVGMLHQLTQSFNLNDTLLKGVLCFLLFRGSVRVNWPALREQRWLVLWLAFAGTAIGCFVAGGLVYGGLAAFGVAVTLPQCLLFGALIAATDPIAALAILSKVGLPRNLETVIDGESLLNDGVAVVLFTIFAGAAMGGSGGGGGLSEAGAIFVREVLGGAAMGVAGWLAIHFLMLRSTSSCTSLLVSLGAVSAMYTAAQHLEISGPIAAAVIRADCFGLTKLLTWGGLRGGLSLALAVSLPDSPWKPLILNMTFAVVIFSIVVQGLTIGRMFTREDMARLLR